MWLSYGLYNISHKIDSYAGTILLIMDTATKIELAKVVDVIVKEVKGVEAIYLFGSMARSNENPKSDYDIAVIVKKYPRNDLTIIANIKCDLFDKIKRPIDVVILEEKDLGQPSLFLYELFNSHIRLYGRVKNAI